MQRNHLEKRLLLKNIRDSKLLAAQGSWRRSSQLDTSSGTESQYRVAGNSTTRAPTLMSCPVFLVCVPWSLKLTASFMLCCPKLPVQPWLGHATPPPSPTTHSVWSSPVQRHTSVLWGCYRGSNLQFQLTKAFVTLWNIKLDKSTCPPSPQDKRLDSISFWELCHALQGCHSCL